MLACPRCNGALPETFFNAPDLVPCPGCDRPIRVEVFPALLSAPRVGGAGEAVLIEGESSCFYHPAKRAAAACDSCGRFLCALCDIDLNGRHLCPGCLQTGKRKGKLKQLENHRLLYDSLSFTLALAPMLIFYFTILTAPATIYIVLRHGKAEGSIVGRSKWRMVVAFIIALLQIAGWVYVIYYFMGHTSHRGVRR